MDDTLHASSMCIENEIRRQAFDTRSAQEWANAGKIEAWVHRYLLSGSWANPEFSSGLKRAKRWWFGPVEVKLTDLSPAVGTDPGMEFAVDDKDAWLVRIRKLAESFSHPLSLPPLIIEYRDGELSVRDGNTRYYAMQHLGWSTCWVIIWYNAESDFLQLLGLPDNHVPVKTASKPKDDQGESGALLLEKTS